MSCSLFKKIPDQNIQENNISISWDDSDYNYNQELKNPTNIQIADAAINTEKENPIVDEKFNEKYSKILGVELYGEYDKNLIIEGSEWIGTQYKYGTSVKQQSTDCSGFVRQIYKTVYNIELPYTSISMHEKFPKIDKKDLQEGDLVFFNINQEHVSHVGIYLFNNYFIHASVSNGVIVSSLNEDYYNRFFHSGGRVEK